MAAIIINNSSNAIDNAIMAVAVAMRSAMAAQQFGAIINMQ